MIEARQGFNHSLGTFDSHLSHAHCNTLTSTILLFDAPSQFSLPSARMPTKPKPAALSAASTEAVQQRERQGVHEQPKLSYVCVRVRVCVCVCVCVCVSVCKSMHL
jgi:hypothetical protein